MRSRNCRASTRPASARGEQPVDGHVPQRHARSVRDRPQRRLRRGDWAMRRSALPADRGRRGDAFAAVHEGAAAAVLRAALERVGLGLWRTATAPTAMRSSGSNDLSASAAGFAAGADYRVSPDTVIGAAVAIGETRWNVVGLRQGQCRRGAGRRLCLDPLAELLSLRRGGGGLASRRQPTARSTSPAPTGCEPTSMRTSFGAPARGRPPLRHADLSASRPTPRCRCRACTRRPTAKSRPPAPTSSRCLHGADDDRHPQRARASGPTRAHAVRQRRAAYAARPRRLGARLRSGQPRQRRVPDAAGRELHRRRRRRPARRRADSAVAELKLANGVTLIGKFDGEFSSRSHTLAGTGTLRYAW